MNDNKLYIGIQAASELTGLSVQTLRRDDRDGCANEREYQAGLCLGRPPG